MDFRLLAWRPLLWKRPSLPTCAGCAAREPTLRLAKRFYSSKLAAAMRPGSAADAVDFRRELYEETILSCNSTSLLESTSMRLVSATAFSQYRSQGPTGAFLGPVASDPTFYHSDSYVYPQEIDFKLSASVTLCAFTMRVRADSLWWADSPTAFRFEGPLPMLLH